MKRSKQDKDRDILRKSDGKEEGTLRRTSVHRAHSMQQLVHY